MLSYFRSEGPTETETKRTRYLADFKAKVALEAIQGDLTLAELGAKHGIHHTKIAAWKWPRDRRNGLCRRLER